MKSLLLILIFLSQQIMARGNEGAHGGDIYAMEFTTLAGEISRDLFIYQKVNPALFESHGFTAERFQFAINPKQTRVISAEGTDVILNGREVEGINVPSLDKLDSGEIMINRTRWREADLGAKLRLVLHEYFGILNVERDAYDVSDRFDLFLDQVTRRLAATRQSIGYMGNLYYGRCIAVPALTSPVTCEANTEKIKQAESCAMSLAEGKCRLSGRSKCELSTSQFTEVLSKAQLGLRYCEVLVIMK